MFGGFVVLAFTCLFLEKGSGSGPNQLASPLGVAFDSKTRTLYISDTDNNRVMKYEENSTSGVVVAGGNGRGRNNTQLMNPQGIHFESSTNSLLIANTAAHNVVRWRLGDSYWTLIAGNSDGRSGNGSFDLNQPFDVITDQMGNIYVADTFNYRIQFYMANQLNGTTVAGITGQNGTNANLFSYPYSVALDDQLNIYVADTYNQRVQKFKRY